MNKEKGGTMGLGKSIYKVMIRKERNESWDEFTGLFKEEEGYCLEKTEEHMVKFFSSNQFKEYTFGIFKRTLKSTNVFIFNFVKEVEITSWHNKIILE
jgi:hypothetical protein